MKRLVTALALILPLVASAQYEPVQSGSGPSDYGSRRSPWYIGFGFGGGAGNVSSWWGDQSIEEYNQMAWDPNYGLPDASNLTFNFKIGATLTPKVLLGFDLSAVGSSADDGNASASVTIANYDAVVTIFPWDRGLFLRGGLGSRGSPSTSRTSPSSAAGRSPAPTRSPGRTRPSASGTPSGSASTSTSP